MIHPSRETGDDNTRKFFGGWRGEDTTAQQLLSPLGTISAAAGAACGATPPPFVLGAPSQDGGTEASLKAAVDVMTEQYGIPLEYVERLPRFWHRNNDSWGLFDMLLR